METLFVFLAIVAIQMIATYSKQKKESAKKAAKQNIPPQEHYEEVPEEANPIPDPFREIREAMGLPPAEKPEETDETFEIPEIVTPEPFLQPEIPEGVAPPDRLPFESAAERKMKAETLQKQEKENFGKVIVSSPKRRNALAKVIDVNRPEQGIIWNMILQEPRYRAKWKPKCYR
ncbi:MAG: hypothetical protein LBB36_00645 [Fibromonadaceae bacterium]|jgi:flagellar biosynthesis component FlhA|nr:hypothetical protein [Fibromonadaceae bacterium]